MNILNDEYDFLYNIVDSKGFTVGLLDNEDVFYNLYHLDALKIEYKGFGVTEMSIVEYNKKKYEEICSAAPFIRDIQEHISEWYRSSSRTALRISGARQIGKTTEILKFAYSNYNSIIYINLFTEDIEYFKNSVLSTLSPITMRQYTKEKNLLPYADNRSTVIIIDEIQHDSFIYNCIRKFLSNLKCDIIVTGSYLGETLNNNYFDPALSVCKVTMFPMSFKEVCKVFGLEDNLLGLDLLDCDDNVHSKLLKLFDKYKEVGGYPTVISKLIAGGTYNECRNIVMDLMDTCINEIKPYFKDYSDSSVYLHIIKETFLEIYKEKKGIEPDYTSLWSEKYNIPKDELFKGISWLREAGILIPCDMIDATLQNKNVPMSRYYFADCGFINYIATLFSDLNDANLKGLLQENFAATELHRLYHTLDKDRQVNGKTLSYALLSEDKKNYELDFLVLSLDNNKKIGIEIKSNTGSPTSLYKFLENQLVDFGVVAKNKITSKYDGCITIPIYAVGVHFPYSLYVPKKQEPLINRLSII